MESVVKPLPWGFAPQPHLGSPYLTSPCHRTLASHLACSFSLIKTRLKASRHRLSVPGMSNDILPSSSSASSSSSSSSRQLDAFLTMQRTHPEEITVELYSAAATGVVSPIVEKGDINNAM
ncbi:unnamed protein product [Lasius platythorax]|uniref:Uncharacterized protein n=1 Tax=Lasius platythorax TaxID=488582 RepID=A0AAV2NJ99_9HYME